MWALACLMSGRAKSPASPTSCCSDTFSRKHGKAMSTMSSPYCVAIYLSRLFSRRNASSLLTPCRLRDNAPATNIFICDFLMAMLALSANNTCLSASR